MVKQRWVTRAAADPHHVGRLLDDGLRAAGRDRRAARRCPSARSSRSRGDGELPAVDAGAPDGGPGRHAGLRDRPRQLGLDQHQGRPGDVLRAVGLDRLPDAGRLALLARPSPTSAGRSASTAERVDDPDEVAPAVRRALASGGPSLVHVTVDRDLAIAGPDKTGWWDAPSPDYHPEQRARWEAGVAEEQHR